MIVLEKVCKAYDAERYAVRDVSLRVPRGAMLVLLGGSGCGKTTTLKMINRLIEPTSGRIEVNGQDVRAADPVLLRRGIGYVFQGIGLFPHLTIAENVAVVPKLLGWEPERINKRVDELLDMVHLPPAEFRDRQPQQLSGGQQQRVGFARALLLTAGRPAAAGLVLVPAAATVRRSTAARRLRAGAGGRAAGDAPRRAVRRPRSRNARRIA